MVGLANKHLLSVLTVSQKSVNIGLDKTTIVDGGAKTLTGLAKNRPRWSGYAGTTLLTYKNCRISC